MRRTTMSLALAVALVALLSGCHHGESSSPTAPAFGNSVVTGQVFMTGDLAGQSPAGINVSTSGQVATTDASGRFAFIGLNSVGGGFVSAESNGMQFHFTRNDGIDASGTVAANASSVNVQLQKHSATMVATGQQKHELEGKITKISSSSITVNDASTGGDVTAAINGSTVIRKGNTALTTSDLHVGDQVHVKAQVESDKSLTAFEIMLQNSDSGGGTGGGQTQQLEGPITKVSTSSITVHNASTDSDVTAAITGSTVIRHGNTPIKAGDLKAGQQVHVATTGSGDSLTATEIIVQN